MNQSWLSIDVECNYNGNGSRELRKHTNEPATCAVSPCTVFTCARTACCSPSSFIKFTNKTTLLQVVINFWSLLEMTLKLQRHKNPFIHPSVCNARCYCIPNFHIQLHNFLFICIAKLSFPIYCSVSPMIWLSNDQMNTDRQTANQTTQTKYATHFSANVQSCPMFS